MAEEETDKPLDSYQQLNKMLLSLVSSAHGSGRAPEEQAIEHEPNVVTKFILCLSGLDEPRGADG